MTRRKGIEGTVRRLDRRTGPVWVGYVPPSLTVTGKRERIPNLVWETEAAARRGVHDYISKLRNSTNPRVPSSPTRGPGVRRVETMVKDYIDTRASDPRSKISVRTVREYRKTLERQIQHPRANMGKVNVSRVTTPDVERWLSDLSRAGTASSRVQYARRLLGAAFAWEVRQGRTAYNPVAAVRESSSKQSRAAKAAVTVDPVLIPTWAELAKIIVTPSRFDDRVMLATMAWAGLRWSETVSLTVNQIWTDQPRLTIDRVLTWDDQTDPTNPVWVVEPVKGGPSETVTIPTPLWWVLRKLGSTRKPLPEPAGNLLFRTRYLRGGIGVISGGSFNRDAWRPAVKAAGLAGDKTRPVLDPRRERMKIKDLRAFAGSLMVDCGATVPEAARHLRHAQTSTTLNHYLRPVPNERPSVTRAAVKTMPLSLPERIDLVWKVWVAEHPCVVEALRLPVSDEFSDETIKTPEPV